MDFTFQPVAYVRNDSKEFYQVPYQVGVLPEMTSVIEFEKEQNFEMALKDLAGFERIWVIFVFDQAKNWKPKIQPPRGDNKVGVFASRSPHRPNPVGISAVELEKIDGLRLYIRNHDLLDGTPVLDVKPYIPEVDSYEDSGLGWLANISKAEAYSLKISSEVDEKISFLKKECDFDLLSFVEVNLRTNPFPRSNNRIKKVSANDYKMAVKTWRLLYRIVGNEVIVDNVTSGYDSETLAGQRPSKWDDVWMHVKFLERFK